MKGKRKFLFKAVLIIAALGMLSMLTLPGLTGAGETPGGEPITATITDAAVLDNLGELIGMFGLGVPGYGLALALLALLMKLTKWGRTRSLFERVPARYRSLVPLGLGGLIGMAEGLATGLPFWPAVLKGALAVGGGQQLLYEQTKGTGLGNLIQAVTAFIPTPAPTPWPSGPQQE